MEREVDDPVAELSERVAAHEPRLPELARQRILQRVYAQVEGERRARPRRSYAWIALGAAAAAALLLWFWPRTPEPARDRSRGAPQLAASPPQPAPPAPAAPALVPYMVATQDAARAAALLGGALHELELLAGERLLAALSDRARFAIVGPARLSLRSASPARVELELERGLLIGEYDRARGGELAIRAPGATTEITGTLFSVQVQARRTRVAVARGSVVVRSGAAEQLVQSAQALPSGGSAPVAISASDAAPLRELERALRPPAGADHGTLSVTGAQRQVEVDGWSLGQSPVWALVPAGASRVVLRGRRSHEEISKVVRARETTEVVLARNEAAAGASSAPLETARANAHASEALYDAAENAMRAGDPERAAILLGELVRDHPDARSADLALYELARLAYGRSDYGAARAWLERLQARGARAALREPARSLRCEVQRARGDGGPGCD